MAFIILLFLIVFAFLALNAIIYMAFMLWAAGRFKVEDYNEPIKSIVEGVSVLIPFRNEEQKLEACLNSFIKQNNVSFPYELLLIDDGSNDQSAAIIAQFANRLPLQMIQSNGIGKKAALQTGIETAQHNIVYTVDADCVLGPNTLSYMVNSFVSENLNMLCGLVNLAPAKSLFQNLQATESAALVGISAVMLNAHKPATCNGANLMFRKDVFLQLKGYENYKHLSSGDDDFLMHSFFKLNSEACRYAIHADAVVSAKPEHSLRTFFNQRARWASKRKHYIFSYNTYLFVLMGLKFLVFWSMLCFMVISYFYWGDFTPFILFCLLYVSELIFARRLGKVLKLNYLSILFLPLYQFYLPMVLIYGKFFKISWKGRSIHAQ
jgi:glycosyltransferase involved in cell wall biosynthesis